MLNQSLLVSMTSFFMFAHTPSLCDITTSLSMQLSMLRLSISENRPSRIHRCPTDTNKWFITDYRCLQTPVSMYVTSQRHDNIITITAIHCEPLCTNQIVNF